MHIFEDVTQQETYNRIFASDHWVEASLVIGEEGRLITEKRDLILFGGYAIAVSRGGGNSGYQEDVLRSITVTGGTFANGVPEVGCCISSEIDIEMNEPTAEIPRMAQLVPYVRITNGVETSEWIQKGIYYVDTRELSTDYAGVSVLKIHGYDAMLKSEQPFPESTASWPRQDILVVEDIARAMGVDVDDRTYEVMTNGYSIQYPVMYTCREILGYLAAMYAGNFVVSEDGALRLLTLNGVPSEGRVLIDEVGNSLVFGEDRILV